MIETIRKFVPGKQVLKQLTILMSGNTLAQAIVIGIAPILTRLYTPEQFGVLSLFTSMVALISMIAAGKYDMAIMLPKTSDKALNILVLCLALITTTSLLCLSIAYPFADSIARSLNSDGLRPWLPLIALSVFLTASYQAFSYWFNRHKAYGVMATAPVGQASCTAAVNTSLGIWAQGMNWLVIGAVIGQALGLVVFLGASVRDRLHRSLSKISLVTIKEQAAKYKDLPLFTSWSAFLNTCALYAPIFFFSKWFSAEIVGFYALAMRVLRNPAMIISSSVTQVYYQRISEAWSSGTAVRPMLFRAAARLTLIAILPMVLFMLAGPWLFGLVFGAEWKVAGQYTQILSMALAVKFVVSPLSPIFTVVDRIKLGSFWQVSYFIGTFVVLSMAVQYDILTCLWIFAIYEVLIYGFYFLLMFLATKSKPAASS